LLESLTQKQVWRIPKVANVSGGCGGTGGNLVFQGDIDIISML